MASSPLPAFADPLSHGIYCIDTGFHRPSFDAAYLIVEDGHAAFVDTGTNFGVPRLLDTLAALGLGPADVDAVIPTHVHLDHAGGVGLLMQALPHATCWVHERGLRHLVDPSALYQGALAVYGQAEMERSYGQLVAVDASRVRATTDGMTIELAGRKLHVADTPGHARHHHCIWDEASRGWFTGNTFGLSYREFDHPTRGAWVIPTSTPVQFEPELLRSSVQRLLERDPQWMYLTHFGRVGEVRRMGTLMLSLLDEMEALGRSQRNAGDRHTKLREGLTKIYAASLDQHGASRPDARELLEVDIELNAQGMASWLDRESRNAAR